ncbi:MAG: anthranilate synthase component I [Chlamydiae bacterium]|nr:anthranilate synthase component I [Chlamydiota bacterium]MBI3277526.1 anthranilate synthase component I [Chlamydiota bacterium]
MIHPSKKEFLEKSKRGNLIPVVKEILADFETPVSAYLKMAQGDFSFLLESVEGNERIGRYSFLGSSPRWVFSNRGRDVTFQEGKKVKRYQVEGNPLDELKKYLKDYQVVRDERLPRFFGGAVGYIGYGMVNFFDGIHQKNFNDLNLPDMCFIFADTLIAFDHVEHRLKMIANAFIKEGTRPEVSYEEALKRIHRVERQLSSPKKLKPIEWSDESKFLKLGKLKSNVSQKFFEKNVERAKEYIRAGDVFQVVLSQRFSIQERLDPVLLYRVLRSINPSPYMFLLKMNNFHLVGTSPEILVRCEEGRVEVRPIAGTRPRGKDPEEDKDLEKQLLEDPKERAEHLMLVDLGRNDVGRVSKFGSVEVPERMVIEKYSHVIHIVSDVVGKLAQGKDAFDVLKAAFPAGTVTGAPKIRAMQIIEELENIHRGPYAGAIGYFSFSGDLDSCITIRTLLLKDGMIYLQAGAGIVADSIPEKEYQETLNKAKGMLKAVEITKKVQSLTPLFNGARVQRKNKN